MHTVTPHTDTTHTSPEVVHDHGGGDDDGAGGDAGAGGMCGDGGGSKEKEDKISHC